MIMKAVRIAGVATIILAACGTGQARADSSCWQASELAAYDLTMQTLLMAHIAASCDGMAQANPPLKAQLAAFLTKNSQQMDADRNHLNDYYRRAYGHDWQTPLQQSLQREDKRIGDKVGQSASADTCADGAKLISGLANASWADYVSGATTHGWHSQAGLPACQ